MDLNNVYFSNLKKFDGKKLRRLKLSEISQIAGRAGRYLNDGSFGITGQCKEINAEEVELLENHKFEKYTLSRLIFIPIPIASVATKKSTSPD